MHVKSDPMRLVNIRRRLNDARVLREKLDEADFAGIGQQPEIRLRQRRRRKIGVRKSRLPLAQRRFSAGVGVLDVEDRIILRLLDDLGEIEFERRIVLAEKHHEAHGIDADLVDDFAQRDEIAGSASTFSPARRCASA